MAHRVGLASTGLLATGMEEGAQQLGRFLLGDAAIDLRPVMAGRLAEDARPVLDTAALGIGRAVVKAAQAREGNRLAHIGQGSSVT